MSNNIINMEQNKEYSYKGLVINGFVALLIVIALFALSIFCLVKSEAGGIFGLCGGLIFLLAIILCSGFIMQEPNEAKALVFFGKYKGTLNKTGFYWVNPFLSKKRVSLRARNLNPEPIKVNDKSGNPVLIGMVLVWKLQDTYKALFEIDSQSLATPGSKGGTSARALSEAFENFVRVQSDSGRLPAAMHMTMPTTPTRSTSS